MSEEKKLFRIMAQKMFDMATDRIKPEASDLMTVLDSLSLFLCDRDEDDLAIAAMSLACAAFSRDMHSELEECIGNVLDQLVCEGELTEFTSGGFGPSLYMKE